MAKPVYELEEPIPVAKGFLEVTPQAFPKRKLSKETATKFGYGTATYQGKTVQVAPYFDDKGKLVAQHIRLPGHKFAWIGDTKKMRLFGEHLWRDGGRRVIVTEGEVDCLSMSQAQGNQWPVVSIPNGAGTAKTYLARSLEWLERFDEVVLLFDMDEPGRAAAQECAELFSPLKARIAELPLKDANEMLQEGRVKELIDSTWAARPYRPDGILGGEEVWAELTRTDASRSVPSPFPQLDDLTKGFRVGEIATLCAGSGIGKSLVCREIAYKFLTSGEKVGYVALEESVRRTALGLLAVHLSKPLHLDASSVAQADLFDSYQKVIKDRAYFYDHFGSLESENLISKVRFMVKGLGCTFVVLDHLSIVVSGIDNGDERKAIDVTMTGLRSLVQETQAGMILVSHLRRPQGKGHEEGAQVSLADLRGSASIAQLSDTVIGLERNQQDPENKNRTTLRVLKCRHSGLTGEAGVLNYNPDTGRLEEMGEFDAIEVEEIL